MDDWKRSLQFFGALGTRVLSRPALVSIALRDYCARCITHRLSRMGLNRFPRLSAFSLFEIAVALVIISLMTGFALQAGNALNPNTCLERSQTQILRIREALESFQWSQGRLPKPARAELGSNDAGFGSEARGSVTDTTNPAYGTDIPSGMTQTNGVLFGAIPHVTLGLTIADASDCWGSQFTYAVTNTLTSNNSASSSGQIPGTITIKRETLANALPVIDTAAFVLVSHGPDKRGATRMAATGAAGNCNNEPGNAIDRENCDTGNTIFFIGDLNEAEGARHFDDIVAFGMAPPVSCVETSLNLTMLPGDATATALGISADGSVVVGESVKGLTRRGFRWEGGVMTDLGTLGGTYTSARAVSPDGKIVVGLSKNAGGTIRAFRWENGVMTDLGTGAAYAISGDGSVIVGVSPASGTTKAVKWENGVMSNLGALPGFTAASIAYDVSSDGEVIVGSMNAASANPDFQHAFRWRNGVLTDLGTLGGSGTRAKTVTADGNVIFGTGETAAGKTHMFRWENGVLTDMTPTIDSAEPNAVSADGNVITLQLSLKAAYWMKGAMTEMPTSPAWSQANAVSADDRFIAGSSNSRAYRYELCP